MIKRNIKNRILKSLETWPITLITGSRQIGKSTICEEIANELGYKYVSLDNVKNRKKAIEDPTKFIEELGNNKIIIDEVQYVKELFDVLTSIVNHTRLKKGDDKASGMFILTGSQSYHLMQNVSESMAGRVNIIKMANLSMNELNNENDEPFEIDNEILIKKENTKKYISNDQLFETIIKGFYPRLYSGNIKQDREEFYQNYLETYIERDVKQLVNVKDNIQFDNFIRVLATYNGCELIKENIAKEVEISIPTVDSWISVLEAGGLINLVQPYNELSLKKRIIKRRKVYFSDTGLLCYLLEIHTINKLNTSKYKGLIFETYVFNEINKSYLNNNVNKNIFFYRDKDQKQIDFIIKRNGMLNIIEVKIGQKYSLNDIKAFDILNKSEYEIKGRCIICTTNDSYALKNGLLVYPFRVI